MSNKSVLVHVSQLSNGCELNYNQHINYNGWSLRYFKKLFECRRLDSVELDGNKIMNSEQVRIYEEGSDHGLIQSIIPARTDWRKP
jgi:hypothetical protein